MCKFVSFVNEWLRKYVGLWFSCPKISGKSGKHEQENRLFSVNDIKFMTFGSNILRRLFRSIWQVCLQSCFEVNKVEDVYMYSRYIRLQNRKHWQDLSSFTLAGSDIFQLIFLFIKLKRTAKNKAYKDLTLKKGKKTWYFHLMIAGFKINTNILEIVASFMHSKGFKVLPLRSTFFFLI